MFTKLLNRLFDREETMVIEGSNIDHVMAEGLRLTDVDGEWGVKTPMKVTYKGFKIVLRKKNDEDRKWDEIRRDLKTMAEGKS